MKLRSNRSAAKYGLYLIVSASVHHSVRVINRNHLLGASARRRSAPSTARVRFAQWPSVNRSTIVRFQNFERIRHARSSFAKRRCGLSPQTIGLLSGGLVVASIVPYAIRVYQGKIRPVPTTWSLWSFIGLALLLTYRSVGAGANIWPAVFGFTNPTLITIIAASRHEQWKKPKLHEWICLALGMVTLVLWWFVREDQRLSQWALLLALVADLCAWIPTAIFFKNDPEGDRPFAWFLFGVGYFLAIFAVPERTFANYILPLYMVVGALTATLLLVIPRIQRGIPLREWM